MAARGAGGVHGGLESDGILLPCLAQWLLAIDGGEKGTKTGRGVDCGRSRTQRDRSSDRPAGSGSSFTATYREAHEHGRDEEAATARSFCSQMDDGEDQADADAER